MNSLLETRGVSPSQFLELRDDDMEQLAFFSSVKQI